MSLTGIIVATVMLYEKAGLFDMLLYEQDCLYILLWVLQEEGIVRTIVRVREWRMLWPVWKQRRYLKGIFCDCRTVFCVKKTGKK